MTLRHFVESLSKSPELKYALPWGDLPNLAHKYTTRCDYWLSTAARTFSPVEFNISERRSYHADPNSFSISFPRHGHFRCLSRLRGDFNMSRRYVLDILNVNFVRAIIDSNSEKRISLLTLLNKSPFRWRNRLVNSRSPVSDQANKDWATRVHNVSCMTFFGLNILLRCTQQFELTTYLSY